MPMVRERLPDPAAFYEAEGLKLIGRGKWRSAICPFHDDTDPSLRINTASGGFCCMSCGEKGGDVVAYLMQRNAWGFATAARALGAWIDGPSARHDEKPRTLPPRDAMDLIAFELLVILVIVTDIRRGVVPDDQIWQRFLEAVGRIHVIAEEYRT